MPKALSYAVSWVCPVLWLSTRKVFLLLKKSTYYLFHASISFEGSASLFTETFGLSAGFSSKLKLDFGKEEKWWLAEWSSEPFNYNQYSLLRVQSIIWEMIRLHECKWFVSTVRFHQFWLQWTNQVKNDGSFESVRRLLCSTVAIQAFYFNYTHSIWLSCSLFYFGT